MTRVPAARENILWSLESEFEAIALDRPHLSCIDFWQLHDLLASLPLSDQAYFAQSDGRVADLIRRCFVLLSCLDRKRGERWTQLNSSSKWMTKEMTQPA